MAKYRKKPVVVEAIQWTGLNHQEIRGFVGDNAHFEYHDAAWEVGKGPVHTSLTISTLEGVMSADYGDYIIRGIKGEFYPCKPDVFAETYEEARDDG